MPELRFLLLRSRRWVPRSHARRKCRRTKGWASFAQPDAETPSLGVKSFAELSTRDPRGNPDAGLRIRLRMTEFSGLDPVLDSGLQSAVAGQDVPSLLLFKMYRRTVKSTCLRAPCFERPRSCPRIA